VRIASEGQHGKCRIAANNHPGIHSCTATTNLAASFPDGTSNTILFAERYGGLLGDSGSGWAVCAAFAGFMPGWSTGADSQFQVAPSVANANYKVG
jgi:hypothetical protein